MKLTLILPLVFLAHLAIAQTRMLVQGTKCSLVPPHGFVMSPQFNGFQNAELDASIMVSELPASYQAVSMGFSARALNEKGMTLLDKKEVTVNGSPATLLNVSQSANGTAYLKQILIFGDADLTVMVNGIYPEENETIASSIKDALLSTVYNPNQEENPVEAAAFTMDVTGTEFRPLKYMGGALLFSTDDKIPTEKPIIVVANSIAKISPPDRKQFAEARLRKTPGGEHSVVQEIEAVTINGMNGYEIVADGKSQDGKPELSYQVMLFDDSGSYFLIAAKAREDLPKNLDTFKKLARTFRRK